MAIHYAIVDLIAIWGLRLGAPTSEMAFKPHIWCLIAIWAEKDCGG
jgi:hypothetical protein